jgi:hypothetical protein
MELYMLGHGLGMTVGVAAAVVGRFPETMNNAGSPEVNLGLAVGLVYMQGTTLALLPHFSSIFPSTKKASLTKERQASEQVVVIVAILARYLIACLS